MDYKTVYTNGAVTLTQDYVSGYVYKNNQLDFFFMEQGRVKKLVNGSLRYEYDIKDHLGNTRVCFADTNADGAAEILEESHYYAFGSRIEELSSSNLKNKFTYNGKELEDDHGLHWYHYGARFYDPQIGIWHVVDQVDEFNSPYVYVKNTPVIFIDPDGKKIEIDGILIHNPQIQNDAKNNTAIKIFVFLFGKGGPLYKYTAKIEYNSGQSNPEHVYLKLNGSWVNAQENFSKNGTKWYNVDNKGDYSVLVTLKPPVEVNNLKDNWNINLEKEGGTGTLGSAISHVAYNFEKVVNAHSDEKMPVRMLLDADQEKIYGRDDTPIDHTQPRNDMDVLNSLMSTAGVKITIEDINKINENTIIDYLDVKYDDK